MMSPSLFQDVDTDTLPGSDPTPVVDTPDEIIPARGRGLWIQAKPGWLLGGAGLGHQDGSDYRSG